MNRPSSTARASLTSEQRKTLRALVEALVPASPDGRMPGAADMPQVLQHVEGVAAELSLAGGLDLLEREASARHGTAFAALDRAARSALLAEVTAREPLVLQRLALETVTCYYQQDAVLERLGLEARPPYPKGYQVVSGDLTLLEPVIARGKIYRDAP